MLDAPVLSDDAHESMNQILLKMGTISMELPAVDAVCLISGIQSLLMTEQCMRPDFMVGRLESFARELGNGIKKHPKLINLIDGGWSQVAAARSFYSEAAITKAKELPQTKKDLQGLCKAAGLPFSRKNKSQLVESLENLDVKLLVAAKQKYADPDPK